MLALVADLELVVVGLAHALVHLRGVAAQRACTVVRAWAVRALENSPRLCGLLQVLWLFCSGTFAPLLTAARVLRLRWPLARAARLAVAGKVGNGHYSGRQG